MSATACHLHAIHVGHWAGNLGDSAVFDVLDRALPPAVRLTMEVECLGDWRRRSQTSFIHWQDQPALEAALQACDAVIISGTTVVTDLHAGDWPIAWVVKSMAAARAHGKPVHAIGVGVYPSPQEARTERFLRDFAGVVEDFSVRDTASRDALLAAGVEDKRIVLAGDMAWLLERASDTTAARAEMDALTGGRPALGVNVVHEDWIQDAEFYTGIAHGLDEIHDSLGTVAVFFCNEIRAGDFFDEAASRRVMALMKTPAVLCPARWAPPENMIARLACCEHAISMRYHFTVFAALAGIPWTGFARGQKNRSLLQEFSRMPILSMGGSGAESLAAVVLRVQREKSAVLASDSQVILSLQQRADLCRKHLRRICSGRPQPCAAAREHSQ